MEKFSADKSTVKELIKTQKYRIPSYQRPYSWERDYIDNFWSYLTDDSDNYFLWTIVLNNEYLIDEWVKDIVDWQQRFITITILYSVIRDIFQSLWDWKKSWAIQTNYIAFQDEGWDDSGYKITVWESIREFFEQSIQSQIPRDIYEIDTKLLSKEQKRVVENYKSFYEKISEELNKQTDLLSKIKFLENLRDKVSSLDIVFIEVSSEDDAYTFFETINATWMKLSTADVLKNLLFKKTNLSKETIQEKWDEILEKLKNQDKDFDITRFIRHYWLSKHEKISDKRLYHSIKNVIDKKLEYSWSYDTFIQELAYNASIYNQILYPNPLELDQIGRSLYRNFKNLKLLWVLQPNPLLLSILRKLKESKNHQIGELFRLIEKIEHFTFIYNTVVNKSPSKLEKIYSKNAVNFYKAKDVIELKKYIAECEADLRQYLPKEAEFNVNFKELRYSKENNDALRYLFWKLNANWLNELQIDNVNIEHIFPQNPSNLFSGDQIKETIPFINDLWNLILIWPKINREASNKEISEKLMTYENSTLPMTKELIDTIKKNNWIWNKDNIINRTEELTIQAWKILSF